MTVKRVVRKILRVYLVYVNTQQRLKNLQDLRFIQYTIPREAGLFGISSFFFCRLPFIWLTFDGQRVY